MKTFIIRRLFAIIPVMLIVATIIFFIFNIVPGDPARAMLGEMATEEQVVRLRETMGLERPLIVQFGDFIGSLLMGDLGVSLRHGTPVIYLIFYRAEPTMLLGLFSLIITIFIGIPTGLISSLKRNSLTDQFFSTASVLGVSIPNFWFGLILILIFAVNFGLLPSGGYAWITDNGLIESFKHLLLPSIALGTAHAALCSRITRSTMLDVINQDYIRTARSKGVSERVIIIKHCLRNALIPIITVVGMSFAAFLGGAVVTEQVFTIPGLGRLLISSIHTRDYTVVQGSIVIIAFVYVFVNFLVDLIYVFIDPRIRYS